MIGVTLAVNGGILGTITAGDTLGKTTDDTALVEKGLPGLGPDVIGVGTVTATGI